MWYFNALKAWWLLILAITVIAGALALIPQPKLYRAEASVLFKFGREYLYEPALGDGRAISGSRVDLRNAINAESKILESTEVLQQALNNIGIDQILENRESIEGLSPEETAVELMREDLSLRMIENSTVMQVYYDHSNPATAASALDSILASFFQIRRNIYQDTDLPLMQRKVDQVTANLNEAESRLQEFNQDNDIYAIDDQQELLLNIKLQATNNLIDAQTQEKQYRANLALIDQRLRETGKTIELFADRELNAQVQEAKNKVLELEIERQSLKGVYRDDSVKVRQINQQINSLKKFLKDQQEYTMGTVRTGRNPLYDSLLSEKISVQAQLDSVISLQPALEQKILDTDAELRKIDNIRTKQRKLKTDFEVLEERQRQYIEQADRVGLAKSLSDESTSNARLIQAPSTPRKSINLSRSKRFVLAVAVGFLFATGLALLLEWLAETRRDTSSRREKRTSASRTRGTTIDEATGTYSKLERYRKRSNRRDNAMRDNAVTSEIDKSDSAQNSVPILARVQR